MKVILKQNIPSLGKAGDLIKVQECRPLSKIIHFVVLGKVNQDSPDGGKK